MNVCRDSPITRSKSHYLAEIGPNSVLSSVSLELNSFGPNSKTLRSLLLHEHPVSKPIQVWGFTVGLQRHTKHPEVPSHFASNSTCAGERHSAGWHGHTRLLERGD